MTADRAREVAGLIKPTFLTVTDKGEPHHTIPMVLFCPSGHRHIDEGEFEFSPHHTHACQECGIVWRPAKVNTHGVQFLPGYKNASRTILQEQPDHD